MDYKKVAIEVAQYNHKSLLAWVNRTKGWESEMHKPGLRWDNSWDYNAQGSIDAVKAFMASPAEVRACRNSTAWP